MSKIEMFLSSNPAYNPIEILIPENCALCEFEGNVVHIVVDHFADLIYSEIV